MSNSMGSVWSNWAWKPGKEERYALVAGKVKERRPDLTPSRAAAILRDLPKDERERLLASLGVKL